MVDNLNANIFDVVLNGTHGGLVDVFCSQIWWRIRRSDYEESLH